MSFSTHAICWHVYPLGFCGAPIRPESPVSQPVPRLRQLVGWLDYVQALGVNVLQLGPIFRSVSHGYDTLDFFEIDPRLGTIDDARALFSAARERGISVLLDGVFNHVAAGGPLDRESLRADSVFEGHGDLVELDHGREQVRQLVVDVMRFWLDEGASGWRLDAAYAVDPQLWAPMVDQVRQTHPGAFIYGEVIHGDYVSFVQNSHVDSVTQYELWKAVWSSLKDRNFFELEWTVGRHGQFCEHFRPVTFVGNHDVTRIATQVGATGSAIAHAVLLTLPGVPMIYYGDEQGFVGTKYERVGGDDEVRPQMPASPEQLSPVGEPLLRWVQQLVAFRRRHPWLVDARVEVTATSNEQFSYQACGPEGQRVSVSIDSAAGTVEVSAPGEDSVCRWG